MASPELRLSEDGRRLSGYAARYDTPSKPGLGFTEIVDRGAFDVSLEAGDDVVALFNHDPSMILGRRDAGTLHLSTDSVGLGFTIDIPDTQPGHMVRELVRRGDLREMSFGFVVQEDAWSNEEGERTRHLRKVQLHDVSVVTSAQYPNTSVQVTRTHTMNTSNGPDLYAELRNLTNQAHAILDQETRNAEDQQKLDRLFSRVDEIETSINEQRNAERLASIDALLDTPTKVVTRKDSIEDFSSVEYRSAFMSYLRTGDRNELRAMNITDDGAVVPTDLERMLVEKLDALSVMRSIATTQVWDSNRDLPVEDAIGAASWVGEAASITPVDTTFGTAIQFRAYKASASVASSNEWLQDSLALNGTANQYLSNVLGRRMAILMEDAFVDGDGSSKPTGIFQEAGVAGTTHTCGSGDTTMAEVDGDDLIDTVHSLSPQYRSGASWLMSDAMLKNIRKLKDSNGNYLWLPAETNAGIRTGLAGTVYGYPVNVVDDAYAPAEAASAKVALFGDMRNFWIADRGTTSVLVDPYSGASTDSTTIYINRRTDSHVILPEAFSVLKLAAS